MKKLILTPLLFCLIGLNGFGQSDEHLRGFKVSDIYFYSGMSNDFSKTLSYENFRALAPSSELLQRDYSNFSKINEINHINNELFSAQLGFKFADWENNSYKSNPLLRIGISYLSGSLFSSTYTWGSKINTDTAFSSKTGNVYYIDSLKSEGIRMNYEYEQIRFDISLIYRTNTKTRWSIYTGLGLDFGLSFNTKTNIYFSEEYWTLIRGLHDGYVSSSYNFPNNYKSESYDNKTNFGFSTYLPMGIDMRLGNKKEFWKKLHLYFEMRPSLNFVSVPELKTYINASTPAGIGLRVEL